MAEPPNDEDADTDGGNLNTVDDGVVGLRREMCVSVGVVTLNDGLRGGV